MFRLLAIFCLIGVWAQPSWAGAGHDHGLRQGQSFPIKHAGSAPGLRHLFDVTAPDVALAVGARVRVVEQTGAPVGGIVLPGAAVVRVKNGHGIRGRVKWD